MRLLALLTLNFLFLLSHYGQKLKVKNVYSDLKSTHASILKLSDTIIYLEVKSKNRFMLDSNAVFHGLYVVHPTIKSGFVEGFSLYSTYNFIGKKLLIKKFKKDSFYSDNKIYDMAKSWENFPPNFYWFFKGIPTIQNLGLSKSKYKKPKIILEQNDTIVIEQKLQHKNIVRHLYIAPKNTIYKMTFTNHDTLSADMYREINISYLNGHNVDSLLNVIKIGDYSIVKNIIKSPVKTLIKPNTTIPLINDSIILSSNNTKFLLFDYWYLNCSPCLEMLPSMIEMEKHIDTSKLIFMGVNTYDKTHNITYFLHLKNYKTRQLDCSKVKPFHTINEHPTLILVDANFKEVKRWVGYSSYLVKDMENYLKTMGLLVD